MYSRETARTGCMGGELRMIKGKGMERSCWVMAFVIIFLIEAAIAVWVRDRFVRPYIGDVLVTALVYSFVRMFVPGGIRRLPLYVFLFAACVEMLQYFRLVELLGLSGCRIAGIVLGSVFDWKDIACYGVGCLLLQWMERRIFVHNLKNME